MRFAFHRFRNFLVGRVGGRASGWGLGIWRRRRLFRREMDIISTPALTCSKAHQKIYLEWFSCADAGSIFRYLFSFLSCSSICSISLWFGKILMLIFPAPSSLSDGDGRITGTDATKFFAMSKLSRSELKQVCGLNFEQYFFDLKWEMLFVCLLLG